MSNHLILYPCMFLSCLIIVNNSLNTRMMYGEIEPPCLHPRSSLNRDENASFCEVFVLARNSYTKSIFFSDKSVRHKFSFICIYFLR